MSLDQDADALMVLLMVHPGASRCIQVHAGGRACEAESSDQIKSSFHFRAFTSFPTTAPLVDFSRNCNQRITARTRGLRLAALLSGGLTTEASSFNSDDLSSFAASQENTEYSLQLLKV